MKLEDIKRTYFVGIGGIGMSSIARWFHAKGISVAGYDKTASSLTKSLENEGIHIHYQDDLSLIDRSFLNTEGTLIVYTPAIPKDHKELNHFFSQQFEIKKRSEVLGLITEGSFTIAVAGTHGKTSTTSMIAYLLSNSSTGCSAFVGGIMTNSNSNLIIGDKNAPVVVEADEYDKSFMRLHPNITVVTSLDPDHLDIYGDEAHMLDTYEAFVKKTPADGTVLMSSIAGLKINPGNEYASYAIKNGDIVADSLRIVNGAFIFTYRSGLEKIVDVHLEVPGFHNVENALAAITVALEMGMNGDEIKRLLKRYRGVKRRFEYVFKSAQVTLIDDYAHHPMEIEAFLKSVKSLAGDRKVTIIFQPHLFTRTNDFKHGFAQALDKADQVILLPIYPARELPIEGVSSSSILDLMALENKRLIAKESLVDELQSMDLDIVCTVGAGDIDREVSKIATMLKERLMVNNHE